MGNCGECCTSPPQTEFPQIYPTSIPPPQQTTTTPIFHAHPPAQNYQSLDSIKRRVKPISRLDYCIPSNGRHAEIYGDSYSVQRYTQEYEPSTFNQERVKQQLVWNQIQQHHTNAQFYHIDLNRSNNKIVANSELFVPAY